jgi:hypothetical protein
MTETIIAFIAGAIFECLCVFWVHFSERGKWLKTGLCSSGIFIAQRTGLAEALLSSHHLSATVACGLGYGFGAGMGVWLKQRPKRSKGAERAYLETEYYLPPER